MIKKTISVVALISSLIAASSAQAADNCLKIGNPEAPFTPGLITAVTDNCLSAAKTLAASGKFPDIFPALVAPKLWGLCYVSTSDIPARLGKNPVSISTVSAWTTEFYPMLIPGGTDNLGSVITQWVVKDSGNKVLGNIYTHDTVDLSYNSSGIASELNVIIAGTGKLTGAKGAVRVSSKPISPSDVEIESVSGTLCLPASN